MHDVVVRKGRLKSAGSSRISADRLDANAKHIALIDQKLGGLVETRGMRPPATGTA